MPEDTNNSHTHKRNYFQIKKNTSSGRQHGRMLVVPYQDNESPLICLKHNQWGNLFQTKLFLFFAGGLALQELHL